MSALSLRRRHALGRLGLAATLLVWSALVAAQAGAGDARQWLTRIQQAAAHQTYQGTLIFSAAGTVSSSRVVHIGEGREHFERVDVLDGQERQQFRHNDQLLTLWPRKRVALFEDRNHVADFPALPADGRRALESYELSSIGSDRIAGHAAEVLLFKPRDARRFAQRVWAERDSGMLLRADVLGPHGEVLESSAFTDVTIGGKLPVDGVLAAMRNLDGYRVVRTRVAHTNPQAQGWALGATVPGFQLVGCVLRPLDAPSDNGPLAQVLQSVFSDGLTHVSVFIEPYDTHHHKPLRTSLGATHTSMRQLGPWWITVVGDVPMATVQQFESMFERRQ